MNKHDYKAPWSRELKAVSIGAGSMLLIIPCIGVLTGKQPLLVMIAVALIGPLITCVCALYAIRGYSLEQGCLLVHRLLWDTRIELSGLQSVREVEGKVMRKGAIKLFGNGGMFSYSGFWRNKTLGNFRACFTTWDTLVLLTFDNKKILVSPDDPQAFVVTLTKERKLR